MDRLKARVTQAALDGAEAAIVHALNATHTVETVTHEPLVRQFRVRAKPKPGDTEGWRSSGPRYFMVKVSEPL